MTAPQPAARYRPPRRRSRRNRAVVVGSLILVAFAVVLMWLVVRFASNRPDDVNLPGGDTFVVGDAERFADRIDDQRAPILFKDPLSSRPGREIYVVHTGTDHETGWSAVLAYAPGAPREVRCILRWSADAARFEDPCGDTDYEVDDERLTRFEAEVNDAGRVEVNLRGRTAP